MKKQFLAAIEEEAVKKQKQEELHAKHNIQDKEVIVVEKSNMIKFSVRSIVALVRLCATILLLFLAAVGLLCLIYPETREPLWDFLLLNYEQLKCYIEEVV